MEEQFAAGNPEVFVRVQALTYQKTESFPQAEKPPRILTAGNRPATG